MTHKEAKKLMSDMFDLYDRLTDLAGDYPESFRVDRALNGMGFVYEDVQAFLHGTRLEEDAA